MFFQNRLLLFGLLLPFLILYAKPDVTRIESYYNLAQGNYLIGDLEGAAKGVEQILKIDPDYLPALALNGRILLDQKLPELALESVERAIQLDPKNLEHQLLKALILGNMNRREEAISVVENVLQLSPEKSKEQRVASKLLGLFLMAEGNLDAAAEVLNQSYLRDPESAQDNQALAGEAYLQKADQALMRNDFETALKAIEQAAQVLENPSGNPASEEKVQLAMLRAKILAQAGQIDESIKTLQEIATQQPDNPEVVVTLASLYISTGQWDLLKAIQPNIAARPELQDIALYLEGRMALAKDRVGTAREAFESALRLLPDGPGKLRASLEFYQGVCLLKTNGTSDGDTKIIASLNNGFQPEDEAEIILSSRALLRDQQAQRAIAYLEGFMLNRGQGIDSVEVWNLLGRAHFADDSRSLALSAFNQSLTLNSLQPETLALRGSLLRKMGDLEGAKVDLENALGLDPENPALTYSLGLIYLQLGKLDSACELIGESAQQIPDNPGLYLLHALLAYTIEAYEASDAALKKYFSRVPQKANESAFYLEYVLTAREDNKKALTVLNEHIKTSEASQGLKNFQSYILGAFDRKAVLDAAGRAETPEIARQHLCEVNYWMAQHERVHENYELAIELLELAIQIGSPDYPEYQFAQWQLK